MSARTRTTCMFSDEEVGWLKSISCTTVSAGVWILFKNRERIDALLDGRLNVQSNPADEKKKRKAEDDEDEATKPGKVELRHKRKADKDYAEYYKRVLKNQLSEYAAPAGKIYTTFNTREEWDEHKTAHPDGGSTDWDVIYARCVRHPDLTDEMRDEAIEAGRVRVREHEAKIKASDDAERERLKHTVKPGMPVQLRKVGEFALANLGLSRTPEEWTDDLIAYVVELDFAGQNGLEGAKMYEAWKRDNSEMLSRMRAKYPVS